MNRSRYTPDDFARGAVDTATGIRTPALVPLDGSHIGSDWLWADKHYPPQRTPEEEARRSLDALVARIETHGRAA